MDSCFLSYRHRMQLAIGCNRRSLFKRNFQQRCANMRQQHSQFSSLLVRVWCVKALSLNSETALERLTDSHTHLVRCQSRPHFDIMTYLIAIYVSRYVSYSDFHYSLPIASQCSNDTVHYLHLFIWQTLLSIAFYSSSEVYVLSVCVPWESVPWDLIAELHLISEYFISFCKSTYFPISP